MISKYFSSLWLDKNGTPNNLTLDRQNAGDLKALRAGVSKAVFDRSARVFTEEGFFKCRKVFLDSIIRQNRGAKSLMENLTSSILEALGTYQLDPTSETWPLFAPGRHMAADALYRNENLGMDTATGQYLASVTFDLFGDAASELMPGGFFADVQETMITPMLNKILGDKFPYLEKKYPDKKIASEKHSGLVDMNILKPTDDWGDVEQGA